ncbi:hypothetical protein RRG08_001597 [Elysia crispata]|uniref:Uncharacterized protein n=1 Tax=Elysia crispata TaxID=231223 RepID=A0AAE1AM21_9GAST|nr:hypothetical protein RRG08_001597 [Elysia crispata]
MGQVLNLSVPTTGGTSPLMLVAAMETGRGSWAGRNRMWSDMRETTRDMAWQCETWSLTATVLVSGHCLEVRSNTAIQARLDSSRLQQAPKRYSQEFFPLQ